MEFPQWVVDRVVKRQGQLHSPHPLNPARTAFVIIDLQNYYTAPGFQGECAAARATFPAVNALATAVRAAGGKVVWVQSASDGADEFWPTLHGLMLSPERGRRRLEELRRDGEGYQIHPDLRPLPDDVYVTKRFFSALVPGASDLAEQLRSRGIDTLLIGGTVTNVCCESTARDAMMMNFRTIMVEDALSAATEFEHVNALINWILYFGDVLPSTEIAKQLAGG